MTIETRYNIGDEVWVERAEETVKGLICGITTYTDSLIDYKHYTSLPQFTLIRYTIAFHDEEEEDWMPVKDYTESYVFPSKEELIKSL